MGTVLVVNPHGAGGSRDDQFARWYNRINPNIGFVSEMGKNDRVLNKTHDCYTGPNSNGMKDTAVVLRNKKPIVSHRQVQVTDDLNLPYAPDRHVSLVRQRTKKILSVHANAVIQNPRTGRYRRNRSAAQWIMAMEQIRNMIHNTATPAIVGGDFNWRHITRVYPRSPEWLARTCNLAFTQTQVMWLMWDADTWKMTDRQVIDGDDIPVGVNEEHPHPALLVELTRKK